MRKLGFHQRWIDLTMMCVTMVHYAVVVNSQPCGLITPETGLDEGILSLLISSFYVPRL
jgi:hypothetical protein